MKIVCIIQARMTSTRLPGKVLMDLAGRPMLAQQIRRLKACPRIDDIVIATTTNTSDDPIVALAQAEGVGLFRGSEPDVLARYVAAAAEHKADVVVRVTGDCPLIDPTVTGSVIEELKAHADSCDYAGNVHPRTYPRGLDTEAFFFDALLRADRMSRSPAEREHVTVAMRVNARQAFLVRSVVDQRDNSDLRWTVDEAADLELVRRIYAGLDLGGALAPYRQVLDFVRSHPELIRLNAGIETWTPHPT